MNTLAIALHTDWSLETMQFARMLVTMLYFAVALSPEEISPFVYLFFECYLSLYYLHHCHYY